MAKDNDRFVRLCSEGNSFDTIRQLWVDRMTGVTYVFFQSGYAGGLTPLLNAQGNPVRSPIPRDE